MAQQRTLRRLRNRSPYRARSARQPLLGNWTPGNLNPFAWYDAHLGGSATQITDSSANARAAATFGAGSNSPLWLQYTGSPYVYCHAAGQRIFTSDVNLSGTTELDIRVAVALDDWTPAATQVFCAHGSTGAATGAFRFYSLASGAWRMEVSNGTAFTVSASAIPSLTDGAIAGIRVTWRSSDGRVQFFTRTVTESTAAADIASNTGWTQLGTDLTNLAAALPSILNPLGFMGYGSTTTTSAAGRFYAGQFATTIDGTATYTFNAASCGQNGYTGGGTTWTIGRATAGRKAVVLSPAANSACSVVLLGTDDWIDVPVAVMPPMTASDSFDIVAVVRRHATPTSFGRYFATRAGSNPGVTLTSNGTANTLYADWRDSVPNAPSRTTTAAAVNGTANLYIVGRTTNVVNLSLNNNTRETTTTVLQNCAGSGARIGADTAGASAQDFELIALLTFARTLSAGEIAQLVSFYGGGL